MYVCVYVCINASASFWVHTPEKMIRRFNCQVQVHVTGEQVRVDRKERRKGREGME